MDDHSELVDYLLDELDELDRARCERRMEEDPALRAEIERLRPLVGRLGDMSPQAWAHVDAALEPAPATAPGRRGARWRWRPSLRLGAVGVAAAGALIVALVLALTAGTSATHPDVVVLSPLTGAPAGARATATITKYERVQLSVEHLRPTDARHYYELWLMTDTTHLVAVASFHVSSRGSASLSLPLPAPPRQYRYLNISLQRAGEGTAISNQSLLRGPTAHA